MLGLKLLKEYDADSILEDEVFETIFDEQDQIMQARMILSLTDRAKELGVKTKFEKLLKAYKREIKSAEIEERNKKRGEASLDNYTNFSSNGKYDNMFCGAWIATDKGVYAQNFMSPNDIVACYHPILPISRLKNIETNEEQIVLAYKRNGHWNEIKVPKDIVSSANKIISLSKYGISVTSENAKHLVRYLSDVENMNDDYIDIQTSTSKLGWHKQDFNRMTATLSLMEMHVLEAYLKRSTRKAQKMCGWIMCWRLEKADELKLNLCLLHHLQVFLLEH